MVYLKRKTDCLRYLKYGFILIIKSFEASDQNQSDQCHCEFLLGPLSILVTHQRNGQEALMYLRSITLLNFPEDEVLCSTYIPTLFNSLCLHLWILFPMPLGTENLITSNFPPSSPEWQSAEAQLGLGCKGPCC